MQVDRLERREFGGIQFMPGVLPCLEEWCSRRHTGLESGMGSDPASFIS